MKSVNLCKEVLENAIGVHETCEKCGMETQPLDVVAVQAMKELLHYRQIGTVEECREAVEKQTETLTVDKAKTIAAKAICIGCGYLVDCKCDYNGGNCMVSKPMLESVLKSFDDWDRRANDEAD